MPKLTLSADRETIKQAKKLARQNKTSVSSMFSRFVRLMAKGRKPGDEIGPLTRKAMGIASLPKGKTYRAVLEEALLEKYGLDK
jgi:hypothetical protein